MPVVAKMKTFSSKTDIQIENALNLHFGYERRSARCGDGYISLHDRKQATEKGRHLVLLIMYERGWSKPVYFYKERVRLFKTTSRLVVYDQGYRVPFGYTKINIWDSKIDDILFF